MNGALPASALTKVDGVQLATPQAHAYSAAIKVIRTRYPHAAIALPWGGYRPKRIQAAMRKAFLARDLAAMRKLGMSLVSRATPAVAGNSPHGNGTAFDLTGAPTTDPWVIATLQRFGWTRPMPSADPNHFVHDGKTATTAPKPKPKPAGKPTPKPVEPRKDDDMQILAKEESHPEVYLVSPGLQTKRHIDPPEYNALKALKVDVVTVPDGTLKVYPTK